MFYNIHRHTHTHTDTHARTHTLLLLPSDRAHESLCFECGSSPSPRPTLTWLTPPPTSRSRPGSAPEALGLTLHALRMVSLTPRESSRCWVATAFCAPTWMHGDRFTGQKGGGSSGAAKTHGSRVGDDGGNAERSGPTPPRVQAHRAARITGSLQASSPPINSRRSKYF